MQFVLERLETLDQLEVLLVLAEAGGHPVSPEDLLAKTLIRPVDLPPLRQALVSKGLAVEERTGALRLSLEPPVPEGVAALLRQFREDPTLIVQSLSHSAMGRARVIMAQALAQAFMLPRKGKPRG
jgi:hypothetical protein